MSQPYHYCEPVLHTTVIADRMHILSRVFDKFITVTEEQFFWRWLLNVQYTSFLSVCINYMIVIENFDHEYPSLTSGSV